MARTALSKRLRFEVFKRDGFRCVYCGVTAVNAVMHVDHVHPVAEGGTDDPANLVTSCRDCNGGKSAVPLDKRRLAPTMSVEDAREHSEQLREYLSMQREITATKDEAVEMVLQRWANLAGEAPVAARAHIAHAIADAGLDVAIEAAEITARKGVYGHDAVRYFCGVLRKRREGLADGKPDTSRPASANAAVRDAQWQLVERVFADYWRHRSIYQGGGESDGFDGRLGAALRLALGAAKNTPAPLAFAEVFAVMDLVAAETHSGCVDETLLDALGASTAAGEAPSASRSCYITSTKQDEAERLQGHCLDCLHHAVHLGVSLNEEERASLDSTICDAFAYTFQGSGVGSAIRFISDAVESAGTNAGSMIERLREIYVAQAIDRRVHEAGWSKDFGAADPIRKWPEYAAAWAATERG